LAASIAHRRAVSRLREQFAKKRGGGQTESLEAHQAVSGDCAEVELALSPLEALGQVELARLIEDLRGGLKPELWLVVSDFFIGGQTYQEIAVRRGLAIGSVGVYLKRALEAIRRAAEKQPKLLKELETFLR